MYLDELKYDLVDVRNYAFSKEFHTLDDLSKRFPIYKNYFEQYFGSFVGTGVPQFATQMPNYMLYYKAEDDFSTDPITLRNILANVVNPPKTGFGDINYNSKYGEFLRIAPFNALTPSQRKVFGEVWEKNTEFSLEKPDQRPNQEPFLQYANQKLKEITPVAQQQIKFLSPAGPAVEQFVVNGVPYTASKFTLANIDASKGSTPRAFIEARDQSGNKVNFTFIPETYLTKGQKIGSTTYMNTNFLNQDFLSNLNGFTLLNRNFNQQFIGQYINDTRQVYDNSAVTQFVNAFGANGFLINSSDLSNKFSGISSSLMQAQFKLDDARLSTGEVKPREVQLSSFAGNLAYKTTDYLSYQRMMYISAGIGAPIVAPIVYENVGMDAYITGKISKQEYTFEKVGSGYVTKSGYMTYDTIRLIPEPQKANWGAFIAGAAGLFVAGSGLVSAIAAASGAAATTSFATAVGQAVGLTGTAASVAGGAIVGASIYSIAGQDPLTGAVLGAIGEFAASGSYAEAVGRAMGATTTATAVMIGNITTSAALSGLKAAVLGQDIPKSMLAGGIVGGVQVASSDIASFVVGGSENLQAIANSFGFYGPKGIEQVQSIISNSIAQGIVAEVSQNKDFGEAVLQSLVANGVSTKVANEVVSNFTKDTPTTKAVFNATRQLTAVATNAAMNNQNINEALEMAAPEIILTTFRTITTPDQKVLDEVQQSTRQQEIQNKQQQIEEINREAMQMAFADADVAAFPALAVSIAGHAALGAYIWLSQKYNELFPDPETAKLALEQSPQAQQFVTIVKMELNKTPEIKIVTNPVTQKLEAKVTIPETPEDPLLKETKEFIERIEAEVKSPSKEAKFNADNIYDELVKIFGEKGAAGEGANDLQTDLEGLEQETNLTETGITPTTPTPTEPGQQIPVDTGISQPQEPAPVQPGGEGGLSDDEIISIIEKEADIPIQKPVDEDIGAGQGAGGGEQPVVLPPGEVSPTEPTEPTQPDTGTPPTDVVKPGGETGEEGPIQPGEGEGEKGEGEGAIPPSDEGISDEDLLDLIRDELFGPGAGEEEGEGTEGEGEGPGAGEEGEGTGEGEEGLGEGQDLVEGGVEGEGDGAGVGGEGGEGTTPPDEGINVRPSIVSILRRPPTRAGESAPYRVTGMDESGILGRKQPLFGGDEDLQRAEWNRRSLRLRRLLGL